MSVILTDKQWDDIWFQYEFVRKRLAALDRALDELDSELDKLRIAVEANRGKEL